MFILICDKVKNFFAFTPKTLLESDENLIENTESNFTNGRSIGWGEVRFECYHLFFQNSQRNTNYNLFAVEVLVISGGHFDHVSWVIYLSYDMIEIDFSLFTAFSIESFQLRFIASGDDDILSILFSINNVLASWFLLYICSIK